MSESPSQLTIAYLTAGHEGLMAVIAQVRKRGGHLLVCDADVEQDGKPVGRRHVPVIGGAPLG